MKERINASAPPTASNTVGYKKKALANRDLAQYRHSSLIVLGFWLVKLANFTHSLASVLFINKFKEMTVKWFHK